MGQHRPPQVKFPNLPDLLMYRTNSGIIREHLYRCHRPIFCQRCKKVFKDKKGLDSHVLIAGADICEAQRGPPREGITPEQESQLRSRKRSAQIQSEEEKWCNIYNLLFPNEKVPSPCKFAALDLFARRRLIVPRL